MDNWKKCVLPDIGKQLYDSIPPINPRQCLEDSIEPSLKACEAAIQALEQKQKEAERRQEEADRITRNANKIAILAIVIPSIISVAGLIVSLLK